MSAGPPGACVNDSQCVTFNARCVGAQALAQPPDSPFIPAFNLPGCGCDTWTGWEGPTCSEASYITRGLTALWSVVASFAFAFFIWTLVNLGVLLRRAKWRRPPCNVLLSTLVLSSFSLLLLGAWTSLEAYRVNSMMSEIVNAGTGQRNFWGDVPNAVLIALLPVFYTLTLLNLALMFIEILTLHPSQMGHNLSHRSRYTLFVLEAALVVCAVIYVLNGSVTMAVVVSLAFAAIIALVFAIAAFKFYMLESSPLSGQFMRLSTVLFVFTSVIAVLFLVRYLYADAPLPYAWTVDRVMQWSQIASQYLLVFVMFLVVLVDHDAIHSGRDRRRRTTLQRIASSSGKSEGAPNPSQPTSASQQQQPQQRITLV